MKITYLYIRLESTVSIFPLFRKLFKNTIIDSSHSSLTALLSNEAFEINLRASDVTTDAKLRTAFCAAKSR